MVAGVAAVAVATGAAVYAAIDDQDDPPSVSRQRLPATDSDGDQAGGAVAAVCAPDHPDCEDMIVVDEDSFEQCAADGPCGDFDARCAAGTECVEPGFPAEALACPEGMTYAECFPDGTPEGWDCVQLESFPVQVECYASGCAPAEGPITILPAPDEPVVIDEPTIGPTDPAEPPEPSTVDPGIAEGEPTPATIIECTPPVDCSEGPASVVHCLPVEPCRVLEDGTTVCPMEPFPPVECAPDEQCLPPDCVISSDGVIACPEPLPLPCVQIDGQEPADGTGCSAPGSCGELGCEPVICPDGISDEECAKIQEESGAGVSGSGAPAGE
jgi:hypothetical protein